VLTGVHVEIEPFGTSRPFRAGQPNPKDELAIAEDGAYVEFDLPADKDLLRYACGPRKTALIATDSPLALDGLNPAYVKVRRYWWELWRTKPE
jgi:hypothetical protein